MMKSTAAILTLILTFIHAPVLQANWVHALLLSAQTEVMSGPRHEMVRLMRTASPNTPMFDRIEVRTETDEFDISRQQYSLRLYPNGWKETENGKKVHHATISWNRAQLDLLVHQALVERYLLVVNLLSDRSILTLKEQLGVVLDDRINVLHQRSGTLGFDIDDLIETESDRTRLKLELIELESDIGSIEDQIRVHTRTREAIDIDIGSLPGIGMIETMIRGGGSLSDDRNIYLVNDRLRAELAQSQYQLEISESRRYVSFFEAAYDGRQRQDSTRAYSLGFGVRLPFVNPNRLDINRRHLRQLREKGRYLDLKNELSNEMSFLSRDLNRLFRQHLILSEKKKENRRSSPIDIYRQYEGIDPIILLKIKEISILDDIRHASIGRDLYLEYIEWLNISGMLSEKPLKNYLSKDLEIISSID